MAFPASICELLFYYFIHQLGYFLINLDKSFLHYQGFCNWDIRSFCFMSYFAGLFISSGFFHSYIATEFFPPEQGKRREKNIKQNGINKKNSNNIQQLILLHGFFIPICRHACPCIRRGGGEERFLFQNPPQLSETVGTGAYRPNHPKPKGALMLQASQFLIRH